MGIDERVDQVRKDNTQKAIMELILLYYNSNWVGFRDTEELTRLEGYTRHSFFEVKDVINEIKSKYGYYYNIKYTYDPCQLFLEIYVEERKEILNGNR